MYKISQFSKISGLTIKALRYYDSEDILKPSTRNVENQYRYYNDDDLQKAQLIKLLRSLDFSIMEIRETISLVNSEDDLSHILSEKIKLIEMNISKEKELSNKIKSYIKESVDKENQNDYAIQIIDISEQLVASIRFIGQYNNLDKYVPLLYSVAKNQKNGRHFNCYYDEDYTENADIEICLPVKKIITHEGIATKTLPKIRALKTTHYGSYDTLKYAYKALIDYANMHQIKTLTPSREIYVKSPGLIFKGNPKHYITEILLPFEVY